MSAHGGPQVNVAAVRARPQQKWGEVTCQDIGPYWSQEFPNLQPGSGIWPLQPPPAVSSTQVPKVDTKGCQLVPCGCLLRTSSPPQHPPFAITPQNSHLVQEWLLETYATSAFNTCPHQPLPLMTGLPPLRVIVKDGTEPVAIHRPSTIPDYWVEQVRQELERDIALGVIKRVPTPIHQQHSAEGCTLLEKRPGSQCCNHQADPLQRGPL